MKLRKAKTVKDLNNEAELEAQFNYDGGLTRINAETKFVLDLKTERVIMIWNNKRSKQNRIISLLKSAGYILMIDDFACNRYGDILIIKNRKK